MKQSVELAAGMITTVNTPRVLMGTVSVSGIWIFQFESGGKQHG